VSEEPVAQVGELRLAPESIEALARRLAELLGSAEARQPEGRLISAGEVAKRWGLSRRWVYGHAEELGAHRIGAGRRPRLRFDPEAVAERLGELAGEGERNASRSEPMRSDCRSDSLSARSRAIVGRQARKRPGRRGNAPRPGAEQAGAMKRLSARSPRVAPPARPPGGQEAGDGD
jgi:hypothetical protein